MSTYVGDVMMPWPHQRLSLFPNLGNVQTIDDESEKLAIIMQAPKTGSIEYVGLGIGNVGTIPAANTDVRIETVNTTTGNPTGTLWDTNTNYGWDITGYDNFHLNKVGPLTANASVSQGDLLAVVYVPPAAPDSGSVNFWGMHDEPVGFPYTRWYNGSSWAAVSADCRWSVVLYYTDGAPRHPGKLAVGGGSNIDFNDTDTYDHAGVEMKMFAVTCILVGEIGYLEHLSSFSSALSGMSHRAYSSVLSRDRSGAVSTSFSPVAGPA